MFAPKMKTKTTDGREVSIQQFLQDSFLNMWDVIARTLGNLEAVIGFEVSHTLVRSDVFLRYRR